MLNRLVALLLTIYSLLLIGCTREQKRNTTVRAAFVPSGYYLPFVVLQGDHLLEKRGYGLELKTYHDNAEMISSFLNGHLDVTAQSAFTMFPVEDEHPGFYKFVYGQYTNGYYFVVPTGSALHKIDDFAGKQAKIATWKSPTSENYIDMIMTARSLTSPRDYTVQKFASTDWPTALEQGAAQAAFGFDVPVARLVSTGRFRYLDEDPVKTLAGPNQRLFNGGAFVSTRLLAEDPQKAIAIRDALWEAIDTIQTNPAHAHQLLAAALATDVKIADAAFYDEFTRPNAQLAQAASYTLGIMRKRDLVHRPFDAAALMWKVGE